MEMNDSDFHWAHTHAAHLTFRGVLAAFQTMALGLPSLEKLLARKRTPLFFFIQLTLSTCSRHLQNHFLV